MSSESVVLVAHDGGTEGSPGWAIQEFDTDDDVMALHSNPSGAPPGKTTDRILHGGVTITVWVEAFDAQSSSMSFGWERSDVSYLLAVTPKVPGNVRDGELLPWLSKVVYAE